ncbi:2-hydroxyglutaryl-CoA dehydratase [Clostridium novyi A str. 4552]|uniref:2-hydroxyglutaryl-CoA dehydratase n=1 Tax=Clostridium novyi A str. 4552 TaxID=1444289 RepID=A0A0A0I8P9_CLONO|nr:acyl-CoA dehydratase activase [Clostridium novyi]KGM97829.1 2-hydroxyglutaryl-CoA dehydratase [Clostridium novyi A str. 4552]
MKTLGIDLGSREVKIVLMENHNIIHTQKISTMSFYKDYCTYNGKILVNLKKLNMTNVHNFISTGYGRNNTNLNIFHPINEIKAHVYGAFYETNLKNFILLDIGGQDVKLVKVENGFITDLELNDKCAASCGRYLENMANILEVSLDYMSRYSENPIELNSTCAVFSESELIGKIAEGIDTQRLCSSVNYSLYKKLKPMLNNFKGKKLILAGGVSKNLSIKKYLQNDYDEIISLNNPQFNGAIGCCYYGENFL